MRLQCIAAERERLQLMQQLATVQELWSSATVETARLLSEVAALNNAIKVGPLYCSSACWGPSEQRRACRAPHQWHHCEGS